MTFLLFSLYCILIPLIMGFWQELLYSFHVGLLWTCLLFSFLPESFYLQDQTDGTLELYSLSRFTPFSFILLSKLIGYWVLQVTGILCSYLLLSFLYHFELKLITSSTFILGSFIFLLICAFHSCLTVSLQKIHGPVLPIQQDLRYLTVLPSLLPLILLCNYIQSDSTHFLFLIGLAGFYLSIFLAFASHILKNTGAIRSRLR